MDKTSAFSKSTATLWFKLLIGGTLCYLFMGFMQETLAIRFRITLKMKIISSPILPNLKLRKRTGNKLRVNLEINNGCESLEFPPLCSGSQHKEEFKCSLNL